MTVGLHLLVELPVAFLITFLAIRALGVRRSWIGWMLAGTAGFVAGNLLAVAVAHGDWGEARLSLNTIAFMALFTMVAAVVLDLLAKPGSLARGDEAGLIVVSNPVNDLRRRIEPLARYREVITIAQRNGLVSRSGAPGSPGRAGLTLDGVALSRTLEQSGVVFIKFGQMASSREDLLPADVRSELARLQTHVDPTPPDVMREQIEAELGDPVERHFSEFDWQPLGSASIAQAYAATLTTGERVVVKIQRPGIEEVVARDTAALQRLAAFLERQTPQGRQFHISRMAEEFTTALWRELDFSVEAREATSIAAATDPAGGLRIPLVYEELSTPRLLVQERFDGVSVADHEAMARSGIDRVGLADVLVATMTRHMLTDGHFHADPHPGNLMLLQSGELGLIDFGATGRLDPLQRAALLEMTLAVMKGDATALRDGLEQITIITPETSDVALERALGRFMADNIVEGGTIGVQAFNDLARLLSTFRIDIPSELTTFFRALALLDGTVRTIEPGYSLIDGMRRLFEPRSFSPSPAQSRRDQLLESVIGEVPRLRRLPGKLDRITTLASRGQLRVRVSLLSTEQDVEVLTRLVNRVLLGVIGSLLGLASAVLVALSSRSSDRRVSVALGYVGLSIAAVLILRVVATIVRDGRN